MALLTNEFTRDVPPELLLSLAWRAVWLHAALTGPGADALAPRDREALALVATSPFGVDGDAVSRHLRRLGVSGPSALGCLERLITRGLLSLREARFDLPAADLAWIHTQVGKES